MGFLSRYFFSSRFQAQGEGSLEDYSMLDESTLEVPLIPQLPLLYPQHFERKFPEVLKLFI